MKAKDKKQKQKSVVPSLIATGAVGIITVAILNRIDSTSQPLRRNRRVEPQHKHSSHGENLVSDEVTEEEFEKFFEDIHTSEEVKNQIRKKREVFDVNNWNRLRRWQSDITQLHETMNVEHNNRVNEAADFLDKNVIFEPAEWPEGECEWATSLEQAQISGSYCANWEGYDKTQTYVTKLLANTSCEAPADGSLYRDQQSSFWMIIPRAMPLWSESPDGHLGEWPGYFNFAKNFVQNNWRYNFASPSYLRLSLGLYTQRTQFIPRGLKMSANSPIERLIRFYGKPLLQAGMPALKNIFETLHRYIDAGDRSTAFSANDAISGGTEALPYQQNCFSIIFIQDVPSDLLDLASNEQDSAGWFRKQVHERCTVVYVFLMPNAKDIESPAGRFITRMEQILFPARNHWLPRDPEFSGVWRLESFEELQSEEFYMNMKQFICLQEKRALCRLKIKGKEVEADPIAADNQDDFYDYYADDSDENLEYELDLNDEDQDFEKQVMSDFRAQIDEPIAWTRDLCCGAELYTGKSYKPVDKMCTVNPERHFVGKPEFLPMK